MPIVNVAKKAMAIALTVALVLAVLGGGWILSLRSENKRLGEAAAQLTFDLAMEKELRLVDQQVALDYSKRLSKLTKQRMTDEKNLRIALTASPEWASQRVPDAVADALGLRDPDDGSDSPGAVHASDPASGTVPTH